MEVSDSIQATGEACICSRASRSLSSLPDSPGCVAVSMAHLTVRGKTLRGYVGDDPVARDYRDYHGWEALLLGG